MKPPFRIWVLGFFVASAGCLSTNASRDDSAIRCVLNDLETHEHPTLSLMLGSDKPRQIAVDLKPVDYTPDPDAQLALIRRDQGWQTLRYQDQDQERLAIESALRHAISRYESEKYIPNLLSMGIQDRTESEHPSVQVWAPGYSPDGRCAVVHVYSDDSWHAYTATFVLSKVSTGWKVEHRTFNAFL